MNKYMMLVLVILGSIGGAHVFRGGLSHPYSCVRNDATVSEVLWCGEADSCTVRLSNGITTEATDPVIGKPAVQC